MNRVKEFEYRDLTQAAGFNFAPWYTLARCLTAAHGPLKGRTIGIDVFERPAG
jgi:hypothetical protein